MVMIWGVVNSRESLVKSAGGEGAASEGLF